VHGAGSVDALLSEVSRMGSGLARSGRPPETPRSNGPLSSQMADGDVAIELHAQPRHGPQVYSEPGPFVLERAMSVEAKTDIVEYLGRQHQAMVALLADLVNIDSGSYNKRGVDAVGERLRAHLEDAGIVCETIPNATYGDCMAARLSGSGDGRPIVLMGHRDTVFPDGTVAQRPFRIDGNQAFGPGVADMKAGLVMNTFVLEALHHFGCPCPLTGLYTSDEEIASPSSRPVIEAEAKGARAVFNSEPGRPSGNLVSRRKGAAFIELEVTGRPLTREPRMPKGSARSRRWLGRSTGSIG
jgi:hypothetical protein